MMWLLVPIFMDFDVELTHEIKLSCISNKIFVWKELLATNVHILETVIFSDFTKIDVHEY